MRAQVEKKKMKELFTCPICNNFYDNATTINECLHTFCKKCIHDKFTEEEMDSCPVCNVYLGGDPFNKLRPDNIIESLKLQVFRPKQKNRKTKTKTETETSLTQLSSNELIYDGAESSKSVNEKDQDQEDSKIQDNVLEKINEEKCNQSS